MSKKQTRRSISVSGELYDRLRAHCEANNTTCSGVVEELLRSFLGMEERAPNLKKPPVPRVSRAESIAREDRLVAIKEVAATKAEPIQATKTVTITTPVLEKNGDWKEVDGRKIAPTEEAAKKAGVALPDLASKIFTF